MSLVDATMTREMLREIGKHPLDISELQVHVTHGVLYLSGRIRKTRGYQHDYDLKEELNIILRILRNKPGVRDVVCEVEMGLDDLSKQPRRTTYGTM